MVTLCSDMDKCLSWCLILWINTILCQRIDRFTCERRPSHTRALKSPGDNGFSIKIAGTPDHYEPGKDYQVFLNGSYANQQFLDFMLVAARKDGSSERDSAGSFTHVLNHMTKEDANCPHVLTSITFHPSYKKSSANFIWTAPSKGTGCIVFKGTVVEHPDIWFSDDGGLTKMLCEKPNDADLTNAKTTEDNSVPAEQSKFSAHTDESLTQTKRQSTRCCACDVAKYEMTFIGNWTRESHPKDFPTKQYESLLHWSDIIGASHSSGYAIWSYGSLASNGVKEVCEYGWPRTLEGEIKQQGRNIRTVIKANGVWGYPAIYTVKKTARFSTDQERPLMSLITMVGPSPDWCIGLDSVNLCLDDCSWVDKLDLELYPWDAGTDSGVTYLSSNLPTFPREKIHPLTNTYPNNSASPFFGEQKVKPLATVSIRRIGARTQTDVVKKCDGQNEDGAAPHLESDSEGESDPLDPRCMVTEWSDFSPCSVTCGVGVKTRTRLFKNPSGTTKLCPLIKLQELDNCLGLINECDVDPNEPVDICVTTPWSNWSPCSVTCGSGSKTRVRQYINPMGIQKCTQLLTDSVACNADIPDCLKATMMVDWHNVCRLPADAGTCIGSFPRFFFDGTMSKCRPFDYGGCRGNLNRFETLDECERTCAILLDNKALNMKSDIESDIDCMVTDWTGFSDCSVSCGTGVRSRSRMIKLRNSGNGRPCPKDLYETKVCASTCTSDSVESVDCMLSDWTHWSDCSLTCGNGIQIRERMVKRPAEGQGQPCDGELKEMRECNMGICYDSDSFLCMLSDWTEWSDCSEPCGEGKTMRQRMEKRGPCPAETEYTQAKPCFGTTCSGDASDCTISPWSDWTECDRPCDLGTQTRFRMINQPAVNGGSCELKDPKQMEKRTCYLQSCNRMTTVAIAVGEAAADCKVGDWTDWSACSKSCGTGKQQRQRSVIQRRKNGGANCPTLRERRNCSTGGLCHRH